MQSLVRFFPPLSEQRLFFILDLLRTHPVASVLDLGCGEGGLLGVLCRPALSLPVPADFDSRYNISLDAPIRAAADKYPAWSLKRVAGLDMHDELLTRAEREINPKESSTSLGPRPRWSDLTTELWKGGLQTYNPRFQEFDVIISSEVIEHLHDDVLESFCPMLLGRYAPDTLVITTPNYEFNQLFTNPPDSSPVGDNSIEGRTSGFLDPTKRTLRLYRHHDHKFEWTREEFHLWCYSNAQSWGYSVEISGVGTSLEPDPWARDKAMTHVDGTPSYATQTAIFKRDRGKEEHRDLYEQRAIHKLDCLQAGTNHQLVMEHNFKRHPGLEAALPSVPESHSVILDLIKDALSEWFRFDEVDLADLWNIDAISIACRGSLEVLYDALIFGGITSESSGRINRHELVEWEWVEPKKRARWARRIRWTRYEPRQHEDEWGLLVEEESQPISTESPWQTVKVTGTSSWTR